MKDEFLMTVSHELRTPLTAIYGWARMLVTGQIRERPAADARSRSIERNAQAQTQLVNDLLDVSRAISGKVRLDVAAGRSQPGRRGGGRSMQPAADAKGIRSTAMLDPSAGADRRRPRSPAAGGLEPAVERDQVHARAAAGSSVALRAGESHVEIAVSDTGAGIDAGSSCRTSSIGSVRPTPARRVSMAASGSAWRSSGTWSSCTAAR